MNFRLLSVFGLICLVSIILFSCKKKKEITSENNASAQAPTEEAMDEKKKVYPIIADTQYSWPGSTDPFTLLSTEVKGDNLILEVQYGGGCQEHDFKMTSNMMWMKSMPPQLNLYLEHDNHDDNCRALITTKLVFDLSNCKNKSGNTVVLIINGDREKTARYQY